MNVLTSANEFQLSTVASHHLYCISLGILVFNFITTSHGKERIKVKK